MGDNTLDMINTAENSYKYILDQYKQHLPNNTQDVAAITGTIFGIKEGKENLDKAKIKKWIILNREIFDDRRDLFTIGKINGWALVFRVLSDDKDVIKRITKIKKAMKNPEFKEIDKLLRG